MSATSARARSTKPVSQRAKRLLLEAFAHLAAPLLAVSRRRRHGRADFRLYLLEYHRVVAGPEEPEGAVTAERLARHARWLVGAGYRPVTVSEGALRLASGALDQDLVAITFDDGYADNFELAWPALRRISAGQIGTGHRSGTGTGHRSGTGTGLPATVYLTTGFLDGEPLWFDVARRGLEQERAESGADEPVEAAMRRLKRAPARERLDEVERLLPAAERSPRAPARPMRWQDARTLRDAGWELGAHTVTHPILSRLDPETQRREIVDSRERIATELGSPPTTFAMPNGSAADYDDATLDAIETAGFLAACTTRRGSNRPGAPLFELRRLGVGADSTALLAARLGGLFDEAMRRVLRRRS